MKAEDFINLVSSNESNSLTVLDARIVYVPHHECPLHIVAIVKHSESGFTYPQVLRIDTLQAEDLANDLLIQARLASPPPPSF